MVGRRFEEAWYRQGRRRFHKFIFKPENAGSPARANRTSMRYVGPVCGGCGSTSTTVPTSSAAMSKLNRTLVCSLNRTMSPTRNRLSRTPEPSVFSSTKITPEELKHVLDCGELPRVTAILAGFKIRDGVSVDARCFCQIVEGPIQQCARHTYLFGSHKRSNCAKITCDVITTWAPSK